MSDADVGTIENKGWQVTMAGLGINLALGVLYSWSVIAAAINREGWGWTATELSLPYRVACLVFCLIMVPAGRMQDKLGPKSVATIGGLLVGMGMIIASFGTTVAAYVFGFGVLCGAGFGFGYASATPPAVKWFPAAKTGLIAGLVVSGFGLAAAYAAPLATFLAAKYSLQVMMMSLGIGFLIVIVGLKPFWFIITNGLASVLTPPPPGYKPVEADDSAKNAVADGENMTPTQMLKTWQFYALWFMYACGAGAGLMIISICAKINKSAGVGTLAVVALALGNGGGRVLAGVVSDKLGRQKTMFLFFVLQAVAIASLALVGKAVAPDWRVMVALSALVGANYGSNLTLFPSATKDYYGLKNFGVNYGLVFTAWGIGGYLLSLFASQVFDGKIVADWAGKYEFAFYTSAGLLLVAAVMTFIITKPEHEPAAAA